MLVLAFAQLGIVYCGILHSIITFWALEDLERIKQYLSSMTAE